MNLLTRIALVSALLVGPGAALGDPPARSRLVGNEETVAMFGDQILRARQDCDERVSALKSVGLATWHATAHTQDNLLVSAEKALKARGFAVKRLPSPADEPSAEDWRQVALLNDAVGVAILDATWRAWFKAKVDSFEYGLGNLTSLLSEQGVDALVFVSAGGQDVSGPYRLFFGPPWPVVVVQLSLADRSGDVLWFEFFASANDYDLFDGRVTDKLFRQLLEEFPGATP